MNAAELLAELRARGVHLTLEGNDLKISAPRGALDEPLRDALRLHKSALLALLKQSQSAVREHDVAIVGMAARLPGAQNVDAYWQLLREGRSGVCEIPAERWDYRAWYAEEASAPRNMGFLQDAAQFDAGFFQISPREARLIDPQQRLFLELSWEAFESAAIDPTRFAQRSVGVFVGCGGAAYGQRIWSALGPKDYAAGLGTQGFAIPNRTSYFFDFRGPSVLVSTACSASLVALHMACESLRRGESELALAGGVNLLLSPAYYLCMAHMGALSPDGTCRTFDRRANGIVLGEGAGALLLKPLSRALSDGDRVLAVIRGSAVNHDGRTNGLSAPNPGAQAELVRRALSDAQLTPGDISYVEAHGTGTQLGDPMEVEALAEVFAGLPRGSRRIGSVKTNLGHLETAAGVASVIKVVLALQHGQLPPHIGYSEPNPLLSFGETPFVVNDALSAWSREQGIRRAGVSGFGMGGTNAHVILEEPPAYEISRSASETEVVITLSARSESALAAQVERLLAHLSGERKLSILDLARTLNAGRAHLPYRRAWTVRSVAELVERLVAREGGRVGHVVEGVEQPAQRDTESLAEAYLRGAPVDWQVLERTRGGRVIDLPSYAWEHERHWVDVDVNTPFAQPQVQSKTELDDMVDARGLSCVRLIWEPLAPLPASGRKARTLVLSDDTGVGDALARQLGCASLHLRSLDAQALHTALTTHADGQHLDVICTAALEADRNESHEAQLRSVLEPALKLVQGILASRIRARLWLCTRGAQAIGDGVPGPAQAALWGVARTIMLEHPELECRALDLDRANIDMAALAATLVRGDQEDQLALRGAELFGARLVAHVQSKEQTSIPAGTVLVTGAFGGLGPLITRWLVAHGVKHVALLARSEVSDAVRAELRALERQGAVFHWLTCDISQRDQLQRSLEQLRASAPPLCGVIHAAGKLDDGMLSQQSWERFRDVLAPKALGALNLAELTHSDTLSFFVSFSSLASLVGAPGQANYAAANACLDALAYVLRARGVRATTLNFGPWSERGMAQRLSAVHQARLRAQGLALLAPEQALELLGQAWNGDHAQLGVLDVDWARFAAALPPGMNPPLLAHLLATSPNAQASSLAVELSALSTDERRSALDALVRREAAKVLGSQSTQSVSADRPLAELGVDSLMAVELRNGLARTLGRPLSATLLFDYPTLRALTDFLAGELFSAPAASSQRARQHFSQNEPIAVIGLGLRMPGGVSDLSGFARFLYAGTDAIREVPRSRWDIDAYYDADPEAPGKMYTRWGSFVEDVERFDADFFGISPREARQMDPQQRLLLEIVWEAIEDANIAAHTLQGSRTGVFMGIGLSGYGQHQLEQDRQHIDGYTATGMITSAAAGRVSYVLGLKGPSLAIETACSSSLVSVHLACQSLRSGESELALAGGVNLLLSPEGTIMFSKARAMSRTGRCKTFDESADGYVRGEGAGVVLLKPLGRALADGDTIHAVIRGSAVNQDGRSGGLTAPNGPSQEAVLRDALSAAGVSADQVSYLEAHGTGTPLGDPIELQAAARVYGEGRTHEQPLLVGSVKTQIGHLEMAAGIAGLLKVICALKRDSIAPHLHFHAPNPLIPWADLPVRVTSEETPWPAGQTRIAAVSAFGFGGTNAHVLLERAPERRSERTEGDCNVLVMSARSESAARELALRFAERLRAADCSVSALCSASQGARTHFSERVALVVHEPEEAAQQLEAFARGQSSRVYSGHVVSERSWPDRVTAEETARAYVEGANPVAVRPARVRLPSYPWQRERFWISGAVDHAASCWTTSWPEQELPSAAPNGRWIVLAKDSALAEALAVELRGQGAEVIVSADASSSEGASGVVLLSMLAAREDEPVYAQKSLLAELSAVLRAGGDAPIWIITRHAQRVGADDPCSPTQAGAWGVGRVLASEHPRRFGGLIDLDASASESELARCLVLRGEQLALRDHVLRAARLLQQRPSAAGEGVRLSSESVYLVTGGSGSVGTACARWLVAHGARHLLLVSRSGTAPRELHGLDAHVETFSADVGSADEIRRLLAHVDAGTRPLAGVVHAAGALDDALLTTHDESRADAVLRPKIVGAFELDRQTAGRALDLFVLVGSSASVLGAAGQAAYAAANAYLTGLSAARVARGERALCVNFGPWSSGMAERVGDAQQRRWAAYGMHLLTPEAALAPLADLLASGVHESLVAALDLPRLTDALGDAALPMLGRARPLADASLRARAPALLRARLLALPKDERARALKTQLETDLARVLGLPSEKRIDPERGFSELGVDSLLALELRNRLAEDLGLTLSVTLAMDHPTLARLSEFLLAELDASDRAAPVDVVVERVSARSFDEPIAIIGMGLRFPGGVHDADSYWRLLSEGVDATREVPRDRWDIDALYDPDPDAAGRIYTRRGGFLEEVAGFDAAFFGISPREAIPMDPQQRLLLEVAWEALEHAGQSPTALRGTRTGSFVGIGINDYGTLQGRGQGLATIDAYRGTGNGYCFSAGRLSYHLGLQGPSLAVDTACSSSLVAIHLAAQSLRSGECDVALAGGVHLMLAPETMVLLCRTRALSPDGRCKTFAANADGYGRGEGAAIIVLKRLSDALAAGDRIDAVLRASAVNHDGPASGLTVPNGPAQEAVIRQAIARAGIAARDVSYVEAHGTGTALGDPMEVSALASVYGADRKVGEGAPLLVGSVKTNLGHLEAASGIAGLIKVVLSLQHREIPPHLHCEQPSPHIPWRELPVRVPTARTPWRSEKSLISAVSSFGLSGTNAHVLIEEAPPPSGAARLAAQDAEHLVPLSARTPAALKDMAARLAAHLRAHTELSVAQVAATLSRGRAALEYRLAIVTDSRSRLIERLEAAARQESETARERPHLALVFSAEAKADAQKETAFALRAAGVEAEWLIGPGAAALKGLFGARVLASLEEARSLATQSQGIHFLSLAQGSLLAALGELFELGFAVDLGMTAPELTPVPLPSYPWQRRSYWFESKAEAHVEHFYDDTQALLSDHRVAGEPVFPAAGYLTLALGDVKHDVCDLTIESPLRFLAGERRVVRTRREGSQLSIESRSVEESVFTRHASAQVRERSAVVQAPPARDVRALLARGEQTIEADALYRGMSEERLDYGPLYQRVSRVHLTRGEAVGELTLPPEATPGSVHPALLDGCLQVFGAASLTLGRRGTFLPVAVSEFRVLSPVPREGVLYAVARVSASTSGSGLSGSVELLDARGGVVLELAGVEFREIQGTSLERARQHELCFGRVEFVATESEALPALTWEVHSHLKSTLADELRDALCARQSAQGQRGIVLLCDNDSESFAHALETVQAAIRARTVARIWMVTRGPHGALLLGLGRTLELEHPELQCTRVELAADAGALDIVAALSVAPRERELSAAAGQVRAARLTLSAAGEVTPFVAPSEGTILVTGGLGALGLEVAEWLVARGARHLLLTGRSQPSVSAEQRIAALRAQGATVRSAQVDVCDAQALRALLETERLRGIVHAAGVLEDGVLLEQTSERCKRVLAPKVRGGEVLAQLAREQMPDFVLLFSSTAALLGAMGQGAYASANAYLDALAARLRGEGIAAVSLAWGPWAGEGMAARQAPAYERRLAQLGMAALTREQALHALDALAAAHEAAVSIVSLDRQQLRRALSGGLGPALFDQLAPQATHTAASSALRERLADLTSHARREELERLVHELAARVLMRDPGEAIADDVPLGQLGMDSLMAIELRNALNAALAQTFSATLLFDYPTLRGLTDHLAARFEGEQKRELAPSSASTGDDGIAVVGMGCRFPGGADNPELFWQLLEQGIDAITEVPRDRWNVDAYFDEDPEAPGKMYSRQGGFVRDLERFDAHFFGISQIEARSLDPQQRLLLEVCWEALEHAGIVPEQLSGSDTGVFVGIGASGYASEAMKAGDLSQIDAYAATGNTSSAAVGRLSYTLGLEGPNVSIDTACSSSLVGVHLACQSLKLGESNLAIAGGVNVLLSPEVSVMVSKARMLSPEGRCKAFDASADGYVRSEGCGLVVLKRLKDAQRDGDRIWGVIRGSAVNQDGRSSGLTAPSGRAQELVIRRALRAAGIAGKDVSYVEAHGTGTALGDPIELSALHATLSEERTAPLLVGSVKTNIGHLEMAAGVAGLIKVLLSFAHASLPKSLHLRTPNPHVAWEQLNIEVVREARAFSENGQRIAGLSSFGFSGTNAHAIVAAPPPVAAPVRREGPGLVLLSARTDGALRALARAYAQRMQAHPEWTVADVARATHGTRARLERRVAVVGTDLEQVADALARFADGAESGVAHGRVLALARRKVRFLESADADASKVSVEETAWERWGIRRAAQGELSVTLDLSVKNAELARLAQLAQLVVAGVEPDWDAVDGRSDKLLLDLPTYPWQRQRFWLDPPRTAATQQRHPMLSDGMARVSLERTPLLDEHRVHGRVVVPAALLLELALSTSEAEALADLTLHEALMLDDDAEARIRVTLEEGKLRTSSTEDDAPEVHDPVHLTGQVAALAPLTRLDLAALRARCTTAVTSEQFYQALSARGMAYGPGFRSLQKLWLGSGEAFAELGERERAGYCMHPALIDGALQLLGAALASRGAQEVRLPVHIARLDLARAATHAPVFAHAELTRFDDAEAEGRVRLLDGEGAVLLELTRVTLRVVDPALLEALDAVRVRRHAYEAKFRPVDAARTLHTLAGERWAVLLDDGGIGARFATRLEDQGAQVARARAASELAGATYDGVLCLTALDVDALNHDPQRALERACRPTLELVQQLHAVKRLVLATRGGVAARAEDRALSPLQAALWGLGRSIAVERRELGTELVDLDPEHPERTLDQLFDALARRDGESQTAYREGLRLALRLERCQTRASRPLPLRDQSYYLITGGLGALGREAARSLAEKGARHIALLGRSAPDEDLAQEIAQLAERGIEVRCLQADVADAQSLAAALATLDRPLAGVIHAAGTLDDALLENQDWSKFSRVFGPKVLGALHLRELTRAQPLDFSLHYASTAGLLGAAGQANYAAANACLDALAALDHAEGRHSLSVAWGAWAGAGMAARTQEARARRKASPWGLLTPSEGRAALTHALDLAPETSALAFTKLHAHRLARLLGTQRPSWLSTLVSGTSVQENALHRELAQLDLATRKRRVLEVLRSELCRALGLSSDEPLPGDAELTSLGVDSLLAIEVPQVLSQLFALPLGSSLLREQPTLDALSSYIAMRYEQGNKEQGTKAVLVLKRATQHRPLICLGGAPGDALYLGALARHLPAEQPLYALEAPGLDGQRAPLVSIEDIASYHLASLRHEGTSGPFLLAGHSFGGFVAFEMARQLAAAGERVGLLALFDSVGVDWNDAELPFAEDWVAGELARVLFYTLGERQPGLNWEELSSLPASERVLRIVGRTANVEVARPLARRLVAVMKANLEAMVRYRVRPHAGTIHLFRGSEPLAGVLSGQFTYSAAHDLGWHAATQADVRVHEVPGNHFSMMSEPHVRTLAATLTSVLGLAKEAAE